MASPVSGSKRRLRPEQFTKGLNPRQLEAVEHGEGPLLVLAGAGSGKTKVLTSRIGYLIASGVVTPDRVLAITFTNKAAREMKVRLGASLGSVAHDMWVSTFHSACVRMLRPYADRVGLTRQFTILSEDDCKRLLRDICDDLNIDVKQIPVGARALACEDTSERKIQESSRCSRVRARVPLTAHAEATSDPPRWLAESRSVVNRPAVPDSHPSLDTAATCRQCALGTSLRSGRPRCR